MPASDDRAEAQCAPVVEVTLALPVSLIQPLLKALRRAEYDAIRAGQLGPGSRSDDG
jgi:hypothetical protein